MVKGRNQRRALAPKRHIATAKIPHYRDAGMGGNLVVIADLQGIRRIAHRLVPDRLAVAANRNNLRGLQIFLAHQRPHRIGKQPPEARIKLPQLR